MRDCLDTLVRLQVDIPRKLQAIQAQPDDCEPARLLREIRNGLSFRRAALWILYPPDHANPVGLVGPVRYEGKVRPLVAAAVAGFKALLLKSLAAFAVLSFFFASSSKQVG